MRGGRLGQDLRQRLARRLGQLIPGKWDQLAEEDAADRPGRRSGGGAWSSQAGRGASAAHASSEALFLATSAGRHGRARRALGRGSLAGATAHWPSPVPAKGPTGTPPVGGGRRRAGPLPCHDPKAFLPAHRGHRSHRLLGQGCQLQGSPAYLAAQEFLLQPGTPSRSQALPSALPPPAPRGVPRPHSSATVGTGGGPGLELDPGPAPENVKPCCCYGCCKTDAPAIRPVPLQSSGHSPAERSSCRQASERGLCKTTHLPRSLCLF